MTTALRPSRLTLLAVLAASLLLPLVAAPAGATTARFTDVPAGHLFADDIGWLVDHGATHGYPDGTFGPNRPVSRQGYVTFLHRLAGEPDWAGCDGGRYVDVDADHQFCDAITWAAASGITTGFPDATFRPSVTVARQSAAAFLYRAVGSPDYWGETELVDVAHTSQFHGAISWAHDHGITTGYPDGTFRPSRPVTRQAAAAFLHRMDQTGFEVVAGSGTEPTPEPTPEPEPTPTPEPTDGEGFGMTTEQVFDLFDADRAAYGAEPLLSGTYSGQGDTLNPTIGGHIGLTSFGDAMDGWGNDFNHASYLRDKDPGALPEFPFEVYVDDIVLTCDRDAGIWTVEMTYTTEQFRQAGEVGPWEGGHDDFMPCTG